MTIPDNHTEWNLSRLHPHRARRNFSPTGRILMWTHSPRTSSGTV